MIIPPIKKSKIDNTIEITTKYLRESNDLTSEQQQLFADFINILNTYNAQEYPSNNSEEQINDDINTKVLTQSKIDNAIEITKKYLRESEHFSQSQQQLFNDFIHTLEVYKSQ